MRVSTLRTTFGPYRVAAASFVAAMIAVLLLATRGAPRALDAAEPPKTAAAAPAGATAPAAARQGEVRFEPAPAEQQIAERFRLKSHTFAYREEPVDTVYQGLTQTRVTFPSPVVTRYECNNTVHCEYFCPKDAKKKVPAVVVLHILGGDFPLARVCSSTLANRGVAALFLKMPYYGPRRPEDGRKMVSTEPRETVEGMTQAVLDIRRAAAWLAQREEVDSKRLGVFGISLGGITAALASSAEPRFSHGCFLLAGGDIGQVGWESPETKDVRRKWEAAGGTKEEFVKLVSVIDPVTYAQNLKGRSLLMLNAKSDNVIPRVCTESLWHACGEPEIVWYEGNHYTVAWNIFDALDRASRFFNDEPRTTEKSKPGNLP